MNIKELPSLFNTALIACGPKMVNSAFRMAKGNKEEFELKLKELLQNKNYASYSKKRYN